MDLPRVKAEEAEQELASFASNGTTVERGNEKSGAEVWMDEVSVLGSIVVGWRECGS